MNTFNNQELGLRILSKRNGVLAIFLFDILPKGLKAGELWVLKRMVAGK